MKSVVLAVLLSVLVVVSAYAVDVRGGGGVNVGMGISSVSATPELGTPISSRMGLIAGAHGDLNLGMGVVELGFRLGANYEMKGIKSNYESDYGPTKETVSEDYLTIPLRIKLGFDTPVVVPFIAVEPQLGILLSSKDSYTAAGLDTSVDFSDHVESTDFGLGFGGGIDFNLMRHGPRIGVYAKYVLGLTNVSKDQGQTIKNGSFQVLADFSF